MTYVARHKYSELITLNQRLENIIFAQRNGISKYCNRCSIMLNNDFNIYCQFDLFFCCDTCRDIVCQDITYLQISNFKYSSYIMNK